jgi:hypothetical protein
MNRLAVTRTFLVFCLFAASRAFAAGEVHQCVGADGHLTLTDQACEGIELSASAPSHSGALPARSLGQPPAQAQSPVPAQSPVQAPAKSLEQRPNTDVATLKAALLSLQMADAASSRHARLAALD